MTMPALANLTLEVTPAPTDRTSYGAGDGKPGRVPRRSGGFRRRPPVSPQERARRNAWGHQWGQRVSDATRKLREEGRL